MTEKLTKRQKKDAKKFHRDFIKLLEHTNEINRQVLSLAEAIVRDQEKGDV